ncbi:MAG: hypothetical protein FOGNACKC_00769 [Anaerolineae bacterium]|nr:hypothetical protein [Anaerolineae bacterium]
MAAAKFKSYEVMPVVCLDGDDNPVSWNTPEHTGYRLWLEGEDPDLIGCWTVYEVKDDGTVAATGDYPTELAAMVGMTGQEMFEALQKLAAMQYPAVGALLRRFGYEYEAEVVERVQQTFLTHFGFQQQAIAAEAEADGE